MPPVPAESPRNPATSPEARRTPGAEWLEVVQRSTDRLLVLDVFVVMAGALWFGVGVGLHLQGKDSVLGAFQRLWPPLFQPAIGVLMIGALLSGSLGWWRRRGQR
jgi:hypothetical protein